MKNIERIILLAVAILFVGCASLPPPAEMRSETANFNLPKLPEDGKAIVYVVRPSGTGSLIRFNIFVDDQLADSEMGYTRGKEFIYFNLNPGDHQIFSKAENWAEANVSVKAGDIVFIKQDTSMGVVMARNSISRIEDYEGKYHVKHLSLGTILKTDK
jgi:hypothetical protein